MSVYIVAEAGVNHNGSLDLAKKLVDMAADCGADAVKFQTFKAHETTSGVAKKAQYQIENMGTEESQYEMIKKLELPFEYFKLIQAYCKEKGIVFVSTPDGLESLAFLMTLDVPFIKIGSTEVTNPAFLEAIAKTGKPIVLSTGMSNLGEVEKAVIALKQHGANDIQVMQCTTDYPTEYQDVNLRAMTTMREAFKVKVGFSDHTQSNEAAVAAVALGAEIIEKHITLDREMEGPDHRASMPPKDFKAYVRSIRNTEKLLGDGIKRPTAREVQIMKDVRRSIVADCEIAEGTVISKAMITFKRPGFGIAPELASIVEGRIAKRDIKKDEMIMWDDV